MEYNNLKCKDFYIIKLDLEAEKTTVFDEKTLANHTKKVNFLFRFVEKFTQKSEKYWYENYRIDTIDCALDYLELETGSHTDMTRRHIKIWVPKKQKEIHDYVINTWYNKYKILKKSNIFYFKYIKSDDFLNHRINYSKDYTIKEKEIIKNSINDNN